MVRHCCSLLPKGASTVPDMLAPMSTDNDLVLMLMTTISPDNAAYSARPGARSLACRIIMVISRRHGQPFSVFISPALYARRFRADDFLQLAVRRRSGLRNLAAVRARRIVRRPIRYRCNSIRFDEYKTNFVSCRWLSFCLTLDLVTLYAPLKRPQNTPVQTVLT